MYNEFDNERPISGNGMNDQDRSMQNGVPEGTGTSGENAGRTDASGIYRMKFNNGDNSEYTRQFNGYNGQGNYYHNNDYSYYQQTGPVQQPDKKKKKRKGGAGRQFAKVVCFGLVFGLVAGGTMWGVNTLGNKAFGGSSSGDDNGGFSLNVVKTSSQDVQTIEGTDVSDIVEQAKPSIVAVTTVIERTSQDFFGRTYSQEGAGAGSGIIFSEKDGIMYIVTNYHVIADSTEVNVNFNDGSTATATVKGYDESQDIAVLAVDMSQLSEDTKNAVKIAVIGDSDAIKEGEGAIAIGNALGYGQSVTTGTISAVNREVQMTDGTKTMIQTDAAINEGNSGGALLNTRGEVIGINSAKLYGTTIEGMGYAIPINSALDTINNIISGKLVQKTDEEKATLGILGGTVDEASSQVYGWPVGVMVSAVYDSSAAQRAGLSAGDVIVGFNDEEITTMEELQAALEKCNPGDTVTIKVKVPGDDGKYKEERTLKTLLGSAADLGDSISEQ